jgi:hypothetical protein
MQKSNRSGSLFLSDGQYVGSPIEPSKENIHTSQFKDINSSRTNQTTPINSTRSILCSSNQARISCSHKYRARAIHKTISLTNQRYVGIKKYDEKPF